MKALFILVSLVLLSCSSRKVTIQEIKKDSLKQIETKIVTKEETNIAIKNDICIDEFTITPLDTLKDIVVNGITYKNVVLRYKKVKDNSLHIEKKIVSKNELKKELIKTSVKEFKKDIDRKQNYWNYLWLLLIPLIIYLYKKLKSSFFF
jgi:hypothetical protein